jgi:hypothetical protein
MALVAVLRIPWEETNRRHEINIALLTADGKPVPVDTPMGQQAFGMKIGFEIGRPPGVPLGTELSAPFAQNFIKPQLPTGRYIFRCDLDGNHIDDLTLDVA